ncbi:threonine synthase [Meiothermus sp. QL-1]|uniref:threonine synthase n=1 Tax=Meiothermus sp. QL-1 TaxID=2058095 RepID=UPI000E0AD323|nr:threonine synthase [Meiothermus sp. QL-1]RDI96582.1 threonine synthase [Meiothermus sp. QL-1]
MRYFSTRDPQKTPLSFEEALLGGLAPDGGLYLPEAIPRLSGPWRRAASLAELGVEVLKGWLQDPPLAELEPLVREALDFPAPLVRLEEGLYVLELFHGPTLSFKDFGARTMARLMQHFLRKRGERRIILVATSGDTGSAVADGFAGQENIEVVLLYPKGLVSEVQERQLIVKRPGVRTFAVEGTFDDCQRLVKSAFTDPELKHLPLSSANSINIGRLLPQALYYLWAAAQGHLEAANFCVPSGNLGNLTGGVLAALMGLRVPRFLAAHNANPYFPDFLAGRAEPFRFPPTVPTLSNAMDVGAPSNFERLYHLLGPERLREWVWGTTVSDPATLERMQRTYEQYGYLACPHTAVGLEAVHRYRMYTGDPTPIVALSTAHPAKFPDAVRKALGIEPPQEARLEALKDRPVQVEPLPPRLEALKARLL